MVTLSLNMKTPPSVIRSKEDLLNMWRKCIDFCPLCVGKTFPRAYMLKRHLLSYHYNHKLVCGKFISVLCNKVCLRNKHRTCETKHYHCPFCSLIFDRPNRLEMHVDYHKKSFRSIEDELKGSLEAQSSNSDREWKWDAKATTLFLQIVLSQKEKLKSLTQTEMLFRDVWVVLSDQGFKLICSDIREKWNQLVLNYKRSCIEELQNIPVVWEHYQIMKEIMLDLEAEILEQVAEPAELLAAFVPFGILPDKKGVPNGVPARGSCFNQNILGDPDRYIDAMLENEQSEEMLDILHSFKEVDWEIQQEGNAFLKEIACGLGKLRNNQTVIISLLEEIASCASRPLKYSNS